VVRRLLRKRGNIDRNPGNKQVLGRRSPPQKAMVMAIDSLFLTRRTLLLTSAAASAAGLLPKAHAAEQENAIRPFRVNVPEEQLVDLRRRIAATRWPDKETVADPSQGTQLAKLRELVRYWGTGYDWRKAEAKPNALPAFITEIDAVDI